MSEKYCIKIEKPKLCRIVKHKGEKVNVQFEIHSPNIQYINIDLEDAETDVIIEILEEKALKKFFEEQK